MNQRDLLFVSHANPQDNAFTIWLCSRLSVAGYKVWADLLRLRGGDDWQRKIENVIHNNAFKVLLVGTAHGVDKSGVRNEITLALDVAKKIPDDNFIIPLRVSDYKKPLQLANVHYIDFRHNWADGLAELLSTLEDTYKAPRNTCNTDGVTDIWKSVHTRNSALLGTKPESLFSNWLKLEHIPEIINYWPLSDFNSHDAEDILARNLSVIKVNKGILSFSQHIDVSNHLSASVSMPDKILTDHFLDQGWPKKGISRNDARRHFIHIVRKLIELKLQRRHLSNYLISRKQLAWYYKYNAAPHRLIKFLWNNGISGRRQIVGHSTTRNVYWHYGISIKPKLYPFSHVKIIGRVIFTSDGIIPIDSQERMHNLRRSFCKTWRNDKWRDMMQAFLYYLSEGNTIIDIPVDKSDAMSLVLPPMIFNSPVSIINTVDNKTKVMDVNEELEDNNNIELPNREDNINE